MQVMQYLSHNSRVVNITSEKVELPQPKEVEINNLYDTIQEEIRSCRDDVELKNCRLHDVTYNIGAHTIRLVVDTDKARWDTDRMTQTVEGHLIMGHSSTAPIVKRLDKLFRYSRFLPNGNTVSVCVWLRDNPETIHKHQQCMYRPTVDLLRKN